MNRFTLLFLFFGLIVTTPAIASEAMLKQFFKQVSSMQANFQQTVMDESGMTLEQSKGVFYLSRPGKFRWNYKNPDPELVAEGVQGSQIIADGSSIYLYDPDLEQVTQRSMQDALAQVPSLLLVQSGGDINQHFQITDFGVTDGLSWVALKPAAEDASYRQLMIGFANAGFEGFGELRNIVLLDGLGNETRLVLSQVQTNLKLPSDIFNFDPPEGVDVLVD